MRATVWRVKVLRGKSIIEMTALELQERIAPYRRVALDIGAGDGKFVYRQAQAHPDTFFIGLDASPANLTEYAAKILKKPARGGLANVLYVIANVEQLPAELHGLANAISINFPWGSLLDGLVLGDAHVLANIASVAAPGATLEMYINYAVFSDPVPLDVAELPEMTIDYIDTTLQPRYAAAGMIMSERRYLGPEAMKAIPSTWSCRLAFGKKPQTIFIKAELPS